MEHVAVLCVLRTCRRSSSACSVVARAGCSGLHARDPGLQGSKVSPARLPPWVCMGYGESLLVYRATRGSWSLGPRAGIPARPWHRPCLRAWQPWQPWQPWEPWELRHRPPRPHLPADRPLLALSSPYSHILSRPYKVKYLELPGLYRRRDGGAGQQKEGKKIIIPKHSHGLDRHAARRTAAIDKFFPPAFLSASATTSAPASLCLLCTSSSGPDLCLDNPLVRLSQPSLSPFLPPTD